MSGGVDSSVAALLMQEQGYACTGVTMRLYDDSVLGLDSDEVVCAESSCCSLRDVEAARKVATTLRMPFHVFNFAEDFASAVIEKFVASYEAGQTPNPCIDCNRYLKFERLLARAAELDFDVLATGHYARTRYDEASGRWQLLRGLDATKDQSYVLYGLTQAQLERVRFPLGEMRKTEVRTRAGAAGFVNANKPDSQDICFVPDGDYGAFIERWRTGVATSALEPGDILDAQGTVIGKHKGLARYTIGQRKGLEVAVGHPVYVIEKDYERNTITLGENAELYHAGLIARAANWVSIAPTTRPLQVTVKTTYRGSGHGATITALTAPGEAPGSTRLRVDFDEPVRAAAPGQAMVAYDGDLLLCGATIDSVF